MSQFRTVFSTDPKDKVKCPRCRKFLSDCKCIPQETVNKSRICAIIRIETKGRGGKSVIIIDKLPKNVEFLKDLTKQIKTKCATGGTYRLSKSESCIEIQGENIEAVKKTLQLNQINYKGL